MADIGKPLRRERVTPAKDPVPTPEPLPVPAPTPREPVPA
jgi:hypothetical protein